jgi:glyoxylase-like metal-dependent hydrolase (beta-lactamase superfamily II)
VATTHPVLRWAVGEARISRVVESEGPTPFGFLFPDFAPERLAPHAWLKPAFLCDDGRLVLSIHAFVVESRGKRIVVDTCVGNDKPRRVQGWNMRQGRFLQDMAEAGYPRESIEIVLCTHLHVDHVGWNTMLEGGKWVPTFPNARYLFGRREFEHWSSATDETTRTVQQDSVRPILDAGLAELVEMDHRLTPEVRLVPTPGHTPGHVSVHIASQGSEAIVTGDILHHPAQFADLELKTRFDSDAAAATRTRREFFEKHKDGKVLVLGTHFAAPTAGRIVRDGPAFRFLAS